MALLPLNVLVSYIELHRASAAEQDCRFEKKYLYLVVKAYAPNWE
jgi:hypothetical protein